MLWVLLSTLGLFASTAAAVFLAPRGKLRLPPRLIDALSVLMVLEACSILALVIVVNGDFRKRVDDDSARQLAEIDRARNALVGTTWKVKREDRRCAVQFLSDGRIGKPGSPGLIRPDARWMLTSPSNIVVTAGSNSLVLRGKICKGRIRGTATSKEGRDTCTWSAELLQ